VQRCLEFDTRLTAAARAQPASTRVVESEKNAGKVLESPVAALYSISHCGLSRQL